MKNPLNDDHYDGNDAQIDDLKALVRELRASLAECSEFIIDSYSELGYNSVPTCAVHAQELISKSTTGETTP